LRERREDLPALCGALLARIAEESGIPAPTLTDATIAAIAAHPLTGNVRELENLLHRAVALGDGDELYVDSAVTTAVETHAVPATASTLDTAPSSAGLPAQESVPRDLQAWLDQQERSILVRALQENH